jgi:UDP-glucose 4-epimerase
MVRAFERASGQPVPYQVGPRRAGDIAACYADPANALALLGWQATRGLDAICVDTWRGQSGNPTGYVPV